MEEIRRTVLDDWASIPGLVRGLVDGLSDAELDVRPEAAPMSRRELVHHIVEANVVAASIVVAGLGASKPVYDWSWMLPFGPWMDRMGYAKKPIAPALALLEALNAWVAAQVEPLEDGLDRTLELRDEPGGPLRTLTVADVLQQEVDHAREHADELRGRSPAEGGL
jgi:hypothetical protein